MQQAGRQASGQAQGGELSGVSQGASHHRCGMNIYVTVLHWIKNRAVDMSLKNGLKARKWALDPLLIVTASKFGGGGSLIIGLRRSIRRGCLIINKKKFIFMRNKWITFTTKARPIKECDAVKQQPVVVLSAHLAVSFSLRSKWVQNSRGQQWYVQGKTLSAMLSMKREGRPDCRFSPQRSPLAHRTSSSEQDVWLMSVEQPSRALNLLFLIRNLGLAYFTASVLWALH